MKMKILFVDDDVIARRNMQQKIDWNSYDWELLYTARDGFDALEFMKGEKPDVIISDIKMPIMDGLEMAQIAKDYYPDLLFVFLSGYKEFEYAKQALALNALDYINKPIDASQLIKALQQAENKLKHTHEVNQILYEKYPLIKRHYISTLMYNNFQEADDSVFQAFDLNISNGLGMVIFADSNLDCPPELKASYYDILQALCDELTARYLGSLFLCMDDLQLFIIYTLAECDNQTLFDSSISHIEEFINSFFHEKLTAPCTFYHGTVMHQLNDLYLSYQTALQSKNNETYTLLSKIKTYIETNYQNANLTLTHVAQLFNINHCYLTSLYKERFGINLYDYLIQVRMEKAATLLRTTDLKSYEVSEAIGYNNSQYFSASFKKFYGCTTKEYKNKLTNQF